MLILSHEYVSVLLNVIGGRNHSVKLQNNQSNALTRMDFWFKIKKHAESILLLLFSKQLARNTAHCLYSPTVVIGFSFNALMFYLFFFIIGRCNVSIAFCYSLAIEQWQAQGYMGVFILRLSI